MAEKSIYRTWVVPIVVGISIIIGAALIFGLAGLFISQMQYEATQRHVQDDVKELKDNVSQIKKDLSSIKGSGIRQEEKLATLIEAVKELKAEVKGSYTLRLERKRAKFIPESENIEIALRH